MIKLEFEVTPIPRKRMEFSQTLDSLLNDMKDCCDRFEFFQSGNGKNFLITLSYSGIEQLYSAVQDVRIKILSGAISSLCEANEILLNSTKINQLSKKEFDRILKLKTENYREKN